MLMNHNIVPISSLPYYPLPMNPNYKPPALNPLNVRIIAVAK